jgi:competence protein ComEA
MKNALRRNDSGSSIMQKIHIRWLTIIALSCWVWLGGAWAGVEVNHAPQEDLLVIKGIGPATSQRILEARSDKPFTDWDDFIQRVKGVGPAKAAKMSDNGLTVNGARYTPSQSPTQTR